MVLCFKKRIEPFIFLFDIKRFSSMGTEKSFIDRIARIREMTNIEIKINIINKTLNSNLINRPLLL